MNKKIYYRGLLAQHWYNFTESLAYMITARPIPESIGYGNRLHYGEGKMQYVNTLSLKELDKVKKPLFIYIRGGGWISGITEMRNSYIVNWARAGFFTCSINYTNSPQKVFPTQLQEVCDAIDFILDKKEEYCIDTDNIVIAGESAGGYFLTHLAAAVSDPTAFERLGISFRGLGKFRPRAIVAHCCCFNLEHLCNPEKPQSKFPDMKVMLEAFTGMKREELSALLRSPEGQPLLPKISEDFPACFLTWGTMDALRHDTMDFVNKLRRHNVPYRLFKGDGIAGNHAWTIVTMLEKARICLEESFDYVLPLLPDYFTKIDNKWVFRK